ncbi:MAG: hypothetical protein J3R72DRAFT_429067 [Linnemannia gamsii]|nr:MAG: hypothetical protein J3R72DRAFT_429067 [Linnemannia gamsii]
MDNFYVPMNLGGQKTQTEQQNNSGYAQGQQQQQQQQQQQFQGYTPQQQQHQNQYQQNAGAYNQPYQQYQQYQQYYQQPQQQHQQQGQYQGQAAPVAAINPVGPAPSVLPPSYSTPLPPSYSTPLPPSKSKQNQNGNRRQPNNKFNNNNQYNRGNNNQHINNSNPLMQYQAQYQSTTQMGAAAASAAAAALSQFGYNASGPAPGASVSMMSSSSAGNTNTNAPPNPFQQPNTNEAPVHPTNVSSAGVPQADWFSNYQAPTIQQRMAVTMATNAANVDGGPISGQPYHHGGPHGRSNFQRGGHQQQNQRGGRNQRGNRNQQGGIPRQQQQHQRPNHNQQNKQHQQNKGPAGAVPAVNADLEMESSGFHCDACDVTFHEKAKLQTHVAAHRSCPDCKYSASPSLVAEHRKLTHKKPDQDGGAASSSGPATLSSMMASSSSSAAGSSTSAGTNQSKPPQKSKPAAVDSELVHPLAPTLKTPEDIAAWIAQRRKAWPTESNIQKKEQERQEMIAKGQIVEDPSSNKDKNGRDRRGNNNKRERQGKDTSAAGDQRGKRFKTENEDTAAGAPASIEPNEEGDDDDIMDPVKDAVSSKDPTVIKHDTQTVRPRTKCRYFVRGSCNRGDKCPYIHDTAAAAKMQKNNHTSNKKDEFRSRPSLLKMLLSGEIKDEKNKLLEAMRYIVESNFFDKKEPTGALVEEVMMES